MCFSLLSMQCRGGGGILRTVLLIVTVPQSSEMPAPLATWARRSRGIPCVDCTYLLALAKQLESTGHGYPHQENVLSVHTHRFQQCSRKDVLPGLAWHQQSSGLVSWPIALPVLARWWEGATFKLYFPPVLRA